MIRKKDKTKQMEVIAPWDPAIDAKASDVKGYLETLDLSKLKFLPGKQPSKLHLLPASKWLVSNVVQPGSVSSAQVDLARYALQKITNLDAHLLDPEVAEIDAAIPVWQPENKQDFGFGEVLYSTRDDVMIFNLQTIQLVATIVQSNAFLLPGTEKPFAALLSLFQHTI